MPHFIGRLIRSDLAKDVLRLKSDVNGFLAYSIGVNGKSFNTKPLHPNIYFFSQAKTLSIPRPNMLRYNSGPADNT